MLLCGDKQRDSKKRSEDRSQTKELCVSVQRPHTHTHTHTHTHLWHTWKRHHMWSRQPAVLMNWCGGQLSACQLGTHSSDSWEPKVPGNNISLRGREQGGRLGAAHVCHWAGRAPGPQTKHKQTATAGPWEFRYALWCTHSRVNKSLTHTTQTHNLHSSYHLIYGRVRRCFYGVKELYSLRRLMCRISTEIICFNVISVKSELLLKFKEKGFENIL